MAGSSIGAGALLDRRRLVEQHVQLLERGGTGLDGVEQLAHLLDRLEEVLEIEHERGERADRHDVLAGQPAAVDEDARDRRALGQLDDGRVLRGDALGVQVGVVLRVVGVAETAAERVLLVECLHDAYAGHPLLERRERAAHTVTQLHVCPVRLAAEPARRLYQHRDDEQHTQRELPAHDDHHHDRADQDEDVHDEHREALRHELLERVDVGGHARDERTGAVTVVEVQGEMHQMLEHALAEIAEESLTDAGDAQDGEPAEHVLQRDDAQEDDDRAVERRLVARDDTVVDPVAHDRGPGERRGCR